jgi:5-(carboxyamino)imidazole ribonucleotide synthase
VPVRPRGEVLHITQHRLREKQWLSGMAFQLRLSRTFEYSMICKQRCTTSALPPFSRPPVSATTAKAKRPSLQPTMHLPLSPLSIGHDGVLEKRIAFQREVSVVAARGVDGSFAHYGVVENAHTQGILGLTVAPATLDACVAAEAVEITEAVLRELDVIGVLCVEFFVTDNGGLIINELAPRPHNSGHWSFDACVTSQFEQQLRAVCGLPLGSTEILRPAAMSNLLGDLWFNEHHEYIEPNWEAVLRFPEVKLHLYGKAEARHGRKMGHLTALAATPLEAARQVTEARQALFHSRS